LGLAHRRLSIVDLVTGDQPMSNEDGSVWIAFNGEIYNHRELRHRLETAGHRFATQADTEVLVHGWEEWGESVLGMLNGIFAFALADRRRNVVLLARDPMGVKPLYVGVGPGTTWWASELGAARRAGVLDPRVSADGLKLYLMFRFIPGPAAVFEQCWKIPPSHYVLVRSDAAGGTPDFRRYSTRIHSALAPRGRGEWAEALTEELGDAVGRQLMSDVPVGTLLSGGIDSSLVSQMMGERLLEAPTSFGIGFRSEGGRSEAVAAEAAARVLGLPHVTTWVDDDEYLKTWPAALRDVGEPIGNSSGLLLGLLCRTVGRTHKVVLTGQGADEPLGGYPRHMAERLYRLGRLAPWISAAFTEGLLGRGSGDRLRRVMRADRRDDRYLEIFTVLAPEMVDDLVVGGTDARELGRAAIARWIPEGSSGDPMNDLLRVDARTSLVDDLLLIADHFSMRSSVELRVPFLDLQFLELVERMPSRYKVSAIGERKWLYRKAARRYLPRDLATRLYGPRSRFGRKMGFHTPLERWFKASSGPLGTSQGWLGPLLGRNLVRGDRLQAFVDGTGFSQRRLRELVSLYSLSQWAMTLAA
jgi:asparagine synthase (glutamine-hydrolysing)